MFPSQFFTEELALPEFRDKEVYNTDDVELVGEPIGGGQYGKVYMGYLRLEKDTEKKTKVAVKTTKGLWNSFFTGYLRNSLIEIICSQPNYTF